ncbi:Sensory box histidine kinase/response regulator [hydrothermal vent metagenome]|uniref:Sensory box histidine kinase/response regulator n=1 Tax=hydrothermal vent metagenome TaxID=652676 RepID=A0A1W1BCV5_9ZZZZ
MPFIEQNLDIILAGSAILIVIVVYIVIKKRNKVQKDQIYDYSDIEVVEDIYAKEEEEEEEEEEDKQQEAPKEDTKEQPNEEIEEEEETKIEDDISSQAPQESINAPQTQEQQSEQTKKPSNFNPDSKIPTTEVPPHGKIVKDNFKEFSGLKILVAEDNLINQKVIAGTLNESGIELVFANDGLEALSSLNNAKDFDIILMDAHMPNMDGFETTKKIKENPEFVDIPIIALSGDVAADDIKKMYDAGMDAHLEKPLKMDALYDILYAFTKKEQNKESIEEKKEDKKKEANLLLDKELGIEISGGDESFYKEILSEFMKDYKDAQTRLRSMLEKGDLKSADALLLDISGITANIGAEQTHSLAQTLREAIKARQKEKIIKTYQEFVRSFTSLTKAIKDYLV